MKKTMSLFFFLLFVSMLNAAGDQMNLEGSEQQARVNLDECTLKTCAGRDLYIPSSFETTMFDYCWNTLESRLRRYFIGDINHWRRDGFLSLYDQQIVNFSQTILGMLVGVQNRPDLVEELDAARAITVYIVCLNLKAETREKLCVKLTSMIENRTARFGGIQITVKGIVADLDAFYNPDDTEEDIADDLRNLAVVNN